MLKTGAKNESEYNDIHISQKEGVLTGTEALGLIEKGDSSQNNGTVDVQAEVEPRALPKCSLCSSLEHNARTCTER
jgi:hypothetical protein